VDAHRVETSTSFKDVQKQLSDLDEESLRASPNRCIEVP
jgi:hypothetical protein